MRNVTNPLIAGRLAAATVGALLLTGGIAHAQDGGGYHVGENTTVSAPPSRSADNSPTINAAPPVDLSPRLVRFETISGNVTWRADESAAWTKATKNLSLRQGAQIWATEGGRAEILFDDGSVLRIGDGTVITLQSLYTDDKGEFTQIKMASGVATLRPKRERSLYQIDTPTVSVKATGPARVRVGVGDVTEVGVRVGEATVEGRQGRTALVAGDFLALRSADTPYQLRRLPDEDSWERWNDERDRALHFDTPITTGEHRPVAHSSSSVFFSLGFPIGGGYYRPYYYGRGARYHRW